MSDQIPANEHEARVAQGGRGRGAKGKPSNAGGQMEVDAMAGVVRQQPGGDASPDPSQKKKGRGQHQQASPAQGKHGAKGETLQKNQDKEAKGLSSASSAGSLQKPSEWRTPRSTAPMGASGEKSPAPDAAHGAKGVTGQKMRLQQVEISSSDSEEIPHANQMEVEPAEPAARAAASPTATEELSGTHLTRHQQGGSAAPSPPTVPEGGERGDMNLSRS